MLLLLFLNLLVNRGFCHMTLYALGIAQILALPLKDACKGTTQGSVPGGTLAGLELIYW